MAHLVCVTKDCECGYEEDEVIAGIRKKNSRQRSPSGMVLLLGGRLHESCDLVVFLGDELLDLLMEFSFKRISCVEGIRGSFFYNSYID